MSRTHSESLNKNEFLNDYNINMLWDVILDEDIISTNNKKNLTKTKLFFVDKANDFYEGEKNAKKNLIHMNKDFINHIITAFNTEPIQQQLQQQPPPYQHKESYINENSALVKAEDIKSERINKFEQDLKQRTNEFASALSTYVPEPPNFKDNLDKPIGNMEDLIAQTLAQRNFDIEQINERVNIEEVNKFLKGKETSLKSEKIQFSEAMKFPKGGITKQNLNLDEDSKEITLKNVPTYTYTQRSQPRSEKEIKFIKISPEDLATKPDVIELTPPSYTEEKKHITWAEEIDDAGKRKETSDIFSKLKRTVVAPLSLFEDNIIIAKSSLKKPGDESDFFKKEKYDILLDKIEMLNQKVDRLVEYVIRDNV